MKKNIFNLIILFLFTTTIYSQQFCNNHLYYSHNDIVSLNNSLMFDTVSSYHFISYPSLSIGLGNSYGGVGIKYEYRFSTLSFHFGVGYFSSSDDDIKESIFFSGGIKFFITSKDLYLNIQFGHLGIEYTKYTSYSSIVVVKQKKLYGPSLLLGNTFWLSNSVGINGAVGGSYNLVEIEWTDEEKIFLAFDLGVTLRF